MSDQEILDGERVEQLLADPAVVAAFTRLEEQYIGAWKASKVAADREQLHAKYTALDDVRTQLRAVVDAGKVARIAVERRNAQQRPRR